MKINKPAVCRILVTVDLTRVPLALPVDSVFTKGTATVPAEPWETTLAYAFLPLLLVWVLVTDVFEAPVGRCG